MHDIHHLHISFHIKDVGVEGLSRVTLRPEAKDQELLRLAKEARAEEVFYLSTCNRAEFYFAGSQPLSLPAFSLGPTCIRKSTMSIVRHLLEVSLSVDSMVFGESQILGQMKRAYESGLESGLVRSRISPMLNLIIREAKAIRTRVGLTQIHTSVATVAGQMLSHATIQSVLMVGAGETTQTFGQYLKKRHNCQLHWCTRSDDRAQSAITVCGGHQIEWSNLKSKNLPIVDVICVATHSPDVLVDAEVINATKAKYVIDLSVPPNASRADALANGAQYIGIDELNERLESSAKKSQVLADTLKQEVDTSVKVILSDWNNRKAGGFISEINSASESILELELDTLVSKLNPQTEMEKKLLHEWSRRLVKKVNHLHFETLKRVLAQDDWSSDSIEERPHG